MNQENSLKITLLWDFHAVEMPLEDIEVSEGRVCIEELDERTKNGSWPLKSIQVMISTWDTGYFR